MSGALVEELDAHFAPTAEDVEWLSFVGAKGWVAVTQDQLREDPEEQVALMQHGARVLVFKGFLPHHELADLFLRKMKQIKRILHSYNEPFMAKLYVRTGEISVVTLADLYRRQARRRR